MIHKPECIAREQEFQKELSMAKAAIETYDRTWPNYCKECGGNGYFPAPYSQYDSPGDSLCPKCVDVGLCPRCAQPGLYYEGGFGGRIVPLPPEEWETEKPCAYCGFDTARGGGRPELPTNYGECECYLG